MRISDADLESLIDKLRTFSYKTVVNGTEVTVNAEVFTAAQVPLATKLFIQRCGDRKADTILEEYTEEYITATELADIIKAVCVERWKHFLEMWTAYYNPLYDIDVTERRVIETEYGKVTTYGKDSTITDEQVVDGESETTYGLTQTDEQKVNASDTVTFGKTVTHTNPTTTGKVAAFDSASFVNASETTVTNNTDTDSGTEGTTSSMGKVEHSNSGKDTTTNSLGKITHTSSGEDTEELTGTDTVTDTLTKSGSSKVYAQQLLSAEESFWSKYSFFEHWFDDIAGQISLPIYE